MYTNEKINAERKISSEIFTIILNLFKVTMEMCEFLIP